MGVGACRWGPGRTVLLLVGLVVVVVVRMPSAPGEEGLLVGLDDSPKLEASSSPVLRSTAALLGFGLTSSYGRRIKTRGSN